MEREKLLKALRGMTPETGSLVCLGCGHEHNCSIHGCAVIRAAMEEILQLAAENAAMRAKLSPGDAAACRRPMSQAERDAMLDWPPSPAPNLPLTLEELQEMDGEPVWISGQELGCYVVYCGVSTDGIVQFYRAALPSDSYGKTWLAYRRKPEEGMP